MNKPTLNPQEYDNLEPTVPMGLAVLILFGAALTTFFGVVALETWWPALSGTLFGPQSTAYWDLARTSGIVAYLLMWLSVAFGLLITDRLARVWPGGPLAFDLHQFASLLGLAFALFHGLILLGDQYVGYTLAQILLPFATAEKPFWVGLGQVAFYLSLPLTFTFYIRRQLGAGVWRAIHYGSFITFSLITVHGLLAGSDTTNPVVLGMYAMTGFSVVFLTLYRIVSMTLAPARA